jgi:DNA-binding transcriptional MocR family regulator
LWAIVRDRRLSSTDKIVATTLLLKFRNRETGQCNPSYQTVADVIGMSRDTVTDAVKALKEAGYVVVHGTKGGSGRNTNQFEFQLKLTGGAPATGGEHATGGSVVERGGEDGTGGVEGLPHELSIEPSRTNNQDQIETNGPDRSPARLPTGALRDPVHGERTEVVQDRLAKRLGSEGWTILMELAAGELERLTELERQGKLADEVLKLAIADIKLA